MIYLSIQKKVENYWQTRADSYSRAIREEMNSFKRKAWQNMIGENAGISKELEVLDLGAGPGFFTILMADLGYKVTAVDCTIDMLEEARANTIKAGLSAQFIKADVQELPFLDNSFDLIVSRNLVWNLAKPKEAYREWYRILKKEGRLIVFDANWYLELNDSRLQKKYEEFKMKSEEMGYQDEVTEIQEKECAQIAKKLPLTYEKRPEWDKKALLESNFQKVIINEDISEKVWDKKEQIRYSLTPMFSIVAYK